MGEITKTFSPSVNIERDLGKDFNYVVTPNSRHIYEQLSRNVKTGVHSFTIIGSYGTGKSAFLMALRKNLNGDTLFFEHMNGEFKDIQDFEFDYIVGTYGSLINQLKQYFGLNGTEGEKEILEQIDKKQKALKAEGKFWVFVIDEFGKHLEYAAQENPDRELYFVQLIAEYANDENKNMFFITTLHQAFDSYGFGLDSQQRKEWDKVRGRLKELTFNEPVEQLLHIASEYLKDFEKTTPSEAVLDEILKVIELSKVFPLKNELNLELVKSLYPIEPLAAATLSIALQKYGQNERSLFTFLQSDEYNGLNNYDQTKHPFYNLACVYDYLIHNHHSFLSSKYNPHYVQWNALKKAIERVESDFDSHVDDLKGIIKFIGLLNIFSNEGAKIDNDFLIGLTKHSLGLTNVPKLISLLEKKQIIRYRSFKNQYVLFEGTDYDIEHELHQASSKLDSITDVVTPLKKFFQFPYIPAKRVYYEKGTPRYFEFILTEKTHKQSPNHPIDGYINLVFKSSIDEVKLTSSNSGQPILYGVFNNTEEIEKQLFLIGRTKYLIGEIDSDKVASRELNELLNSQIDDLNSMILDNVYSSRKELTWIYNGNEMQITNSKSLNHELSNICDDIYDRSPCFDNELINKEKVSPAVYRPRKNLLERLIDQKNTADLGFQKDEFPAEKTIYLSLLKNSGIHREIDGNWELGEPIEGSGLVALWEASEEFFNSTKSGKKPLTDFINLLKKPPFGLKSGFVELWAPIYLIIKDNDYALFQEEAYIPEITYDIINLVYRNPKLFEIKAYHINEVKKEIFSQYRQYHEQDELAKFSNTSFVETIRPFLLVYNGLNEYGRNTSKISQTAQRLREAIKTATEPEKAFFEDFPMAIGYNNLDALKSEKVLKQYVFDLDRAIEEIKNSYHRLIDRIESCLAETIDLKSDLDFESYQKKIQNRYQSIKNYKLAPYQKKLLGRIQSSLADREKWLSSIAFAILDKPLSKMEDEEESLLLDRIHSRIEELDNLVELDSFSFDPETQDAFRIKLETFSNEPDDFNIIVDKIKLEKASSKIGKIKALLTGDKKINQAILIKIIKELEKNG